MASERRGRVFYAACLLIILLIAALLRFYRLDASSLWSDEGNTWAMLGRGYGEIAAAAAADIHPPGYYWLLKLWSGPFGMSAWAMRSFSAVAGVLLVLLVERIGRRAAAGGPAQWWLPLLAAWLAAVNPLLVYYSQEARMYMLLALAGAGVFWTLPTSRRYGPPGGTDLLEVPTSWHWGLGYVAFAALGLWTHYSFAIVLAAANGAWLAHWLWLRTRHPAESGWRTLGLWVGLNLAALLLFLPWLPTAIASVTNWPKGGVAVSWATGMEATLRTLVFGPLRILPETQWIWLLLAALLPLLGLLGLLWERGADAPPRWLALPLALWLGLPIALMAGLGLFTDAFLKFLITAVPAWCLLAACVPLLAGRRTARSGLVGAVALVALVTAALVLPAYYGDEQARDNYRGVAAFLQGVGDPQRDLVVLNAPGQQEVWRHYDPGLPVLALPQTRPPQAADVQAALAAATAGRRHVYALFWATDEADPDRLVETWLDRHAFKALDTWQGNVRFVTYALAAGLQPLPLAPVALGPAIVLAGQAQPEDPQQVTAGEAALVQLRWEVREGVNRRYKVSVQLLDAANQVVAQRDGEPAGGSRPTDTWRAGEEILDNYALPIPLGTPPGSYRLLAAMYDGATGARLAHAGGDSVELGAVEVLRPATPPPPALLPLAQRLDRTLGPLTLLGLDAYRKDFAHAPETRLRPGDVAHVVLYWQAPDPLPPDWPAHLEVTLRLGEEAMTAPLGGSSYPASAWQPGEILRTQFEIPYDGSSAQLQVELGGQAVDLQPLPVE